MHVDTVSALHVNPRRGVALALLASAVTLMWACNDEGPVSTSGDLIAYSSCRTIEEENVCAIRVVKSDGTGDRRISDEGHATNPAWSPSGDRVAFDSTGDIYVVNADGSDLTNLTQSESLESGAAWSPNGVSIAYREGTGLYAMRSDGSAERRLSSVEPLGSLAWSPDGSQIAFAGAAGDQQAVFVMNSDGSAARSVSAILGALPSPRWSPDGTRLAFELCPSAAPRPFCHVAVVAADGSNLTVLTDDPIDDRHPVWSPDGMRLAFGRIDGIYVMNADGSGLTRLLDKGGSPTWSSDGARLAFSMSDGSNDDVYTIGADGGDVVRLTRNDSADGLQGNPAIAWAPIGVNTAVRGDRALEEAPTATPARTIPAPVAFAEEPAAGFMLGDPSFAALPSATAYFGRLGGANYQIEIPDAWNGRLVMYAHGFMNFASTLSVTTPGIRGYLVRNGFAWAASSYSSNAQITGMAADETAALWDHFVQRFGRPERTYVMGHSMGGGATSISAERYATRYDGALALCAIAGSSSQIAALGDLFVVGAFVAGVTQPELDAMNPGELVDKRVLPALNDPEANRRFEEIVIDLTGGPRPFDRGGLLLAKEGDGWFSGSRLVLVIPGVFNNADTVYRLGPGSDVPSDTFNAAAVRFAAGPSPAFAAEGDNFNGRLAIPLLTLHTTGDLGTPISEEQIVRRRAEDAGRGDLLVQRTVRAPGHCTFTNAEWEASLEALIGWVEKDERPGGEDLLSGDLRDIGAAYTLAPRIGSPEADEVLGAAERVTVRGTLTLDGRPASGGYVWVVVRSGGLMRYCSLAPFVTGADGQYEVAVASERETHGCGGPGAELYIDLYMPSLGRPYWSDALAKWPVVGDLTFDAAMKESGAYLPNTMFRGSVIDASGERLPPGTLIEAYIGDTLCGATSLPRTVMALGEPSTYYLPVVGPASMPGCDEHGTITFRVNGEVVAQTGINDFDGRFEGNHVLDLSVP